MTGAPTFDYFHNKNTTTDYIFNLIKGLIDNSYAVGAATVNIVKTFEDPQHAFAILSVHDIELDDKSRKKLVRMYNPYNHDYWGSNPWGDNSSNWTPKIKNQLKDYINANDGLAFVSIEDYLKNFGVTNWVEVKQNYEAPSYDVAIKEENAFYEILFIYKGNKKDDIYVFLDRYEERVRYFCDEPFKVTGLKVITPQNVTLLGNDQNKVKIEKAVDGIYSIKFSFKRLKDYLKFFTINAYAPEKTLEFVKLKNNDINFDHMSCPKNCNGKGSCNTKNGKCKCFIGVKKWFF